MFEKASRQKLVFATTMGNLNTEDLWDLSLEKLDTLAQSLESAVKASKKKSFITKSTKANTTTKLRFSIVKHIIDVKLEEREQAENKASIKAYNQKILEKIEAAQDRGLDKLSVKELKKLLK